MLSISSKVAPIDEASILQVSFDDVELEEDIRSTVRKYKKLFRLKKYFSKNPIISQSIGNALERRIYILTSLLSQAQMERHSNEASIYHALQNGTFDMTLVANPKITEMMDDVGAYIIHSVYLYEKYDVGRKIVTKYPYLGLKGYSSALLPHYCDGESPEGLMPFSGESILHMTIVRKNLEETRWILDFYRDHRDAVPNGLARLLISNAVGNFFRKDGQFYFGGYPLHFAVCTKDKELFDLVLSYSSSVTEIRRDDMPYTPKQRQQLRNLGPNSIFMRDDYGNTVLHLCVLHNLKEMYSYILETANRLVRQELKLKYSEALNKIDLNGPVDESAWYVTLMDSCDECTEICVDYPLPAHEIVHIPMPVQKWDGFINIASTSSAQFEEWLSMYSRRIIDDRLVFALNSDYHTPLTLAAKGLSTGDTEEIEKVRKEMLEFLIGKAQSLKWQYGPLKSYLVEMEGLETPCNPCRYRNSDVVSRHCKSVIDILCQEDADACISIPQIKAIIETKWQVIGYPIFLRNAYINVVIIILITVILCYVNSTPTSHSNYSSEVVVTVFYPITAFLLFILFLSELPNILRYGLDYWGFYGGIRGAAVFDKYCRGLITVSFLVFCILKGYLGITHHINDYASTSSDLSYNPQDFVGVKVSLSICVLSAYAYVYFFFMGFDSTGPFVLTVYRIISRKIPFFLLFYCVILVGFACALSMLTNDGNPSAGYGFWRLILAIWTLIHTTVNASPTNDVIDISLVPPDLQWLFDILLTSYFVIVVLMMMNLLIAMINDTWVEFSSYNQSILLMEKYNVMNGMMRSLSSEKVHAVYEKFGIYPISKPVKILEPITSAASAAKGQKEPSGSVLDALRSRKSVSVCAEDPCNALHTTCLRPIDITVSNLAFEYREMQSDWWDEVDDSSSNGQNHSGNNEKVILLIVDPQADFAENGKVPIPGFDQYFSRVAEFIRQNKERISEIYVGMTSRYRYHISHPNFWRQISQDSNYIQPLFPYVSIALEDLGTRVTPLDPGMKDWAHHYLKEYRKKRDLNLTLFPEHCVVGTKGHSILSDLDQALQEWIEVSNRDINYMMRDQNFKTIMFSVFAAEIEDDSDPLTKMNHSVLQSLKIADRLIICGTDGGDRDQGRAYHYNFLYSLEDLVDNWSKDNQRLVVLQDGNNVSKEVLQFCQDSCCTVCCCDQAFDPLSLPTTATS